MYPSQQLSEEDIVNFILQMRKLRFWKVRQLVYCQTGGIS